MRIYENAKNEIFRERADKSGNVRINRSVKRYYGNVKVVQYMCMYRKIFASSARETDRATVITPAISIFSSFS